MRFVWLKCRNSHMKQPKLLSVTTADALSELEVCQNTFAVGALPRPPLEKLFHTYSNKSRARSLKYCSTGALALGLAERFL